MSTHIYIPCPSCRRRLKVRREYIGKQVGCKHCQYLFQVEAPEDTDLFVTAAEPKPRTSSPAPEAEPSQFWESALGIDPTPTPAQAEPRADFSEPHAESPSLPADPEDKLLVATDARSSWSIETEDPLEKKLQADRAERDRLRAEVQSLRAELTARQAVGEEPGPSVEDHGAIRAECDRLEAEVRGLRAECDRLESERLSAVEEMKRWQETASERERALVEETERHALAFGNLNQEFERGRGEWGAERHASQLHWEQEARDAEQRLAEQQAGAAGDQQRWKEQLDAAREQFERNHESFKEDLERFRAEVDALRGEHDAAQGKIEELTQERDRLAGQYEHVRSTLQDTVEAHRVEVDRLNEESEQGRRQAAGAFRSGDEFAQQVHDLQTELDHHQSDRETRNQDQQSRLATIHEQYERLQSEATAQSSAAELARAELSNRLALVQGQLDEASARHAKLESQFEAAAAARSELERELESSRDRVQDLTKQVAQAENAKHQIKSLLEGVGIRLP